MKRPDKAFIYGTHYWRPPNPPRDQHRRHLQTIRNELGFDLIRCRLQWNWHHRRPEAFDFDEVHEILDICEEVGLAVLIEMSLESAPYWLEEQYPQARYVNANGRAIELGSQEATPGGGHPGLCFHNSPVVEHGERYYREIVRQFKNRDSLSLYDCWNEPHLEPCWCNNPWGNMGDRLFCYCEASRAAFRDWLERRYGTIHTLNDTWARAYTSFRQVNPPILQGNYSDWLDWLRFWLDELQENMRWRVRVIKEEDPDRLVVSHSGATPPVLPRANACIDNWRFAEPVDMWGTSFAPQAFSWDLATCAQVIEVTRSSAGGKPFWVSEMPGGASNIRGFRKSRMPRAKDYHVWNWLAAALGSQGTVHWCYLTERTGHETGGYGMMRADGSHTHRSLAIRDVAADLRKHQDVLLAAEIPTQVAVLNDADISSLLFAMELSDDLYGKSHVGYYRAIWHTDLNARFITPGQLDKIDEPILIVPMGLLMSDESVEHIAAYVRRGGTLIADARAGMFDSRGWLRPKLPAGKLAEAAGLVEEEMLATYPKDDAVDVPSADGSVGKDHRSHEPSIDPVHKSPIIKFTQPLAAGVAAEEFVVPLSLEGGEAIGKYGDMTLGAHHRYGEGHVYYFGTYMGLALEKNSPGGHDVVRRILADHATPTIRGQKLRPRLLTGDSAAMLMVFNEEPQESVEELIDVPKNYTHAVCVRTGQTRQIEDGRLSVEVGPEDVGVFRLES